MSAVEVLPGTCPSCDGEAEVFPSNKADGEGHVYCQEDDCGMIHRHMSNVRRFVDADTAPEWAKPQVEDPAWTVDVDPESDSVALEYMEGAPQTNLLLSIVMVAQGEGYELVAHSGRGDQLTFAPGGEH